MADDDLTPEDIAAAAKRRRQLDEIKAMDEAREEAERRRQERERLPDVHPPSEWVQ